MTAARRVVVTCDRQGCPASVTSYTATEARIRARVLEWTVAAGRIGVDYCPEHTEEALA